MQIGPSFNELPPAERQAVPERLALPLETNAAWADDEGNDALGMMMRSVGTALLSAAGDLADTDIALAEDVAVRAVGSITRPISDILSMPSGRHFIEGVDASDCLFFSLPVAPRPCGAPPPSADRSRNPSARSRPEPRRCPCR